MTRKLLVCLALALLVFGSAQAQKVTGSITGTVLDPSGAAVPGAKVQIANEATGYKNEISSTAEGSFVVADLPPASYKLRISLAGFKTFETTISVRVGTAVTVEAKLVIGEATSIMTVESSAVVVDTVKATVQGVVEATRIEQLPLNGRNFLDLAQQEPGVQVVDGGNFDPTKNQFAGVSIGGRSGRVTRIQVDGVDITDETVGTTVTNISNESIQEFGIQQSNVDVSTDVTSSGAVNIVTRSGSNELHGSGAFFFRNQNLGADQRLDKTVPSTDKPPFDREIIAARVGGRFIKDKLFWHMEYEYTNQDGQRFTNIPEFPQYTGAFSVPIDERLASGRLDWTINSRWVAFYRFNHNYNNGVTGFGARDLTAFANLNNTNFHVMGADYRGTNWTHGIRFSYLNFNNFIVDANAAAGTPQTLDPGGRPLLVRINGFLNDVGPDLLAPQQTFQDNKQTKYDANWIRGQHTFSFGAEWNKIDLFGFANFFGLAPRIRANYTAATRAVAATNLFGPGGIQNPLNYPTNQIRISNGLGYFSEKSALGFPFGGAINHRLAFYGHDSWRVTRNFTMNYGVRYSFNSGQNNHDLPRTSIIALFDPAMAGVPNLDTNNFGPQAGFAWNVFGDGKTVIRAGAGIFYETNIANNFIFDRVANIPPGIGNAVTLSTNASPLVLDPVTGATLFNFSTQCAGLPGNSCFGNGAPLGAIIPFVLQAQQLFVAANAALAANYPAPGVPPLFDTVLSSAASGAFIDPQYKTPYGIQMNIGMQREIKPGLVFGVDYIRNRGVHFNLATDRNRSGAADTLNVATATAAVSATNAAFGCGALATAAATNCAIAAGATIGNYAGNGLGAGSALDGFAFQGRNPNFRDVVVNGSQGVSLFQALQFRLQGKLGGWGWFKSTSANINYSLSRFESTGADQDFLSGAGFNDRPTKFYGPSNLDRMHQVVVGLTVELPKNFRIATTSAFRSPLASSLFLPSTTAGADEIFFSDLDGDGVTQDPLGLTNPPRGAFSRRVSSSDLNRLIASYNSGVVGQQITPAGQALVSAGLFTQAQLQGLGATVLGGVPLPNDGVVNNDGFFNTDLRFSWTYKITERVRIEPMIEVFNLFNIANYGVFTNVLNGAAGDANGTKRTAQEGAACATAGLACGTNPVRFGAGSGSFSPGGQRAFQLAVRVSF